MADSRTLALHATLPERYERFDVLTATIDHRGRLLTLLVDPAQNGAEQFPWRRRGPWTPPVPRYDAIAVIRDGNAEHRIALPDLDQWFSHIDAIGDGVVLAAARIPLRAREPDPPRNVVTFDSEGTPIGACYAGDGIDRLLTDPDGRIWVGYFDESTYGSAGPNGTWSLRSMPGLARWDTVDAAPWFAHGATGRAVDWIDCYALNVGRNLVHACPYTRHPLVELDASGVRSITPNPITGCSALAVAGDAVAFLDQGRSVDTTVWTIRKAHRRDSTVTETATELLTLPGGRPPTGWARGMVGRDATLWIHQNGDPRRWYRYELEA